MSGGRKLYGISLAQWSLNRQFFGGKIDALDFAKVSREEFDIGAIEYVNQLTDTEFALSMYSSVQNRTKDLLACLELRDVRGANGLQHVWKILDGAFEQMGHERFAAAWRAWESAQRLPGQPMADWIGSLKKIKLELKEQDTTTLSDEAVASKILRCSGLPSREHTQVLHTQEECSPRSLLRQC